MKFLLLGDVSGIDLDIVRIWPKLKLFGYVFLSHRVKSPVLVT
jgi:hypothetical protein